MDSETEYPKAIFKTQHSEVRAEYKKGFDKKTGKLIIDPTHPYQN